MEIQTLMPQGRSTKTISMIKWIRISTLSIKNSLSGPLRKDPSSTLARAETVVPPWAQGLGFALEFRVQDTGFGV